MSAQWLTTIGLLFDILGAILVAYEVVRKFDGIQFVVGNTYATLADPPKKTKEYIRWEIMKYRFMVAGLVALLLGFVLQIAATWIASAQCAQ